ncbi:hypothetical protein Tco_1111540, partial [Tanacetum coccineum]
RMTKFIKGEFEKIKDVKVEDLSLTYDTSLERNKDPGHVTSRSTAQDRARPELTMDRELLDANEHIEKVLEIVDLFHIPNITIDQVMLRAFPMSLTEAASRWLRNKPTGSITTWEDLKTKFLSKYCPPTRTSKKMEEINNFQKEPDKNLYQAWEYDLRVMDWKLSLHYLTELQEGDNYDNESSDDDNDDDDVEKDEEDGKEEEHLAPVDLHYKFPTDVLAPQTKDAEAVKTDEF